LEFLQFNGEYVKVESIFIISDPNQANQTSWGVFAPKSFSFYYTPLHKTTPKLSHHDTNPTTLAGMGSTLQGDCD
jgi:hypothetical protein